MSLRPNVLLAADDGPEMKDIREFLRDHAAPTTARTLPELRRLLRQGSHDAFVCGSSFDSASWKELLEIAEQESPGVPAIVLSRNTGGREWREALAAGAFDLVSLPVPLHTLLGIIEQAVASQQARTRWTHFAAPQASA